MEISLNQCCEWLEETQRNEERLLAAVILERDLALFTSSHFFQRASHFFSNIFKVIRDPKLNLRIAATQALHIALSVTSQREAKLKNEWYKVCLFWKCLFIINCFLFSIVLKKHVLKRVEMNQITLHSLFLMSYCVLQIQMQKICV